MGHKCTCGTNYQITQMRRKEMTATVFWIPKIVLFEFEITFARVVDTAHIDVFYGHF